MLLIQAVSYILASVQQNDNEQQSSWRITCKWTTQCCRRDSYPRLGLTSEQASAQLKTTQKQFQKARLHTTWTTDHRRSLLAIRDQVSSQRCSGKSYKSWRYTTWQHQQANNPWPKGHIHIVSGIAVLSKIRKSGTMWKTGQLSCKAGMPQK